MSGFFALLDDIATLAKLTMSTLDDTAGIAVKTSAKVSAAAVDDVAATPQYVTGITPDREIPIIKKIARGSLRNKLLIILPAALLLSAVAPGLLPLALVIGGTYLCLEGGEKILESLAGAEEQDVEEREPQDEGSIVSAAVRTDLVLSTEIMLLALADVAGESSLRRVVILVIIAFFLTFAVYGLVGALIKLDDLGVHLAERGRAGATRSLGRGIVRAAPGIFTVIGVIGTVAMLWVGGHILATNLAELGFEPLHDVIIWAEELSRNAVASWVCGTAAACLIGTVVGVLLAGALTLVKRLAHRDAERG